MQAFKKIAPDGTTRSFVKVHCGHCGDTFDKQKRFVKDGKADFCSTKCMHESRLVQVMGPCGACGNKVSKAKSKVGKSGLLFCNRKCKEQAQSGVGRVLKCGVSKDGSTTYRSLAFHHYQKKCEWCQFDIEALLDVHHVDHDRSNNRLENLLVLCVMCHAMETRKLVEVVGRLPEPLTDDGKRALTGRESMAAGLPCKQVVTGSIPVRST